MSPDFVVVAYCSDCPLALGIIAEAIVIPCSSFGDHAKVVVCAVWADGRTVLLYIATRDVDLDAKLNAISRADFGNVSKVPNVALAIVEMCVELAGPAKVGATAEDVGASDAVVHDTNLDHSTTDLVGAFVPVMENDIILGNGRFNLKTKTTILPHGLLYHLSSHL